MGLQFSPLYFIYHDGWKWKETKKLQSYDSNGNPILIDKSKEFYHRGHVHLFLPDYNVGVSNNTWCFTGEQEYNFEIKDEWGPNSNDPNQNRSIKLLGKPLWYYYVEEYWRRMYIQPYDQVDLTCKLPLNQSVVYDKYTFVEYLRILIEDIEKSRDDWKTFTKEQLDWYYETSYNKVKFNDYCTIVRKKAARLIWIENYVNNDLWKKMFNSDFNIEKCTDAQIVAYIRPSKSNMLGIYMGTFDHDYSEDFEKFYQNNAVKYSGYIKNEDAMKEFISLHQITYDQYDRDADGYIYIPRKETEGHIGIKYDASKSCHSLGPFREGGQLYFYNTVVNRTMPCEYWLDEDKKTRQYYLKQKDDNDETTGGGTWTFSNDNTHFIWVEDSFSQAKDCIDAWELGEKEYNSDSFSTKYTPIRTYYNHRKRNIYNSEYVSGYNAYWQYCYNFQNAKCIKTDKFFYDANTQKWMGNNDKVVHDDNLLNFEENSSSSESNNSSSSGYLIVDNFILWNNVSGWEGWYEYGEIIKCAHDEKWYKRTWKPLNYKLLNPYELQTKENAPQWHFYKRQAFPNPPPWLCDNPYKEEQSSSIQQKHSSSSSNSSQDEKHFAIRNDVYDNDEDNRIHMLHWEYCHYYNLIRYYNKNKNTPGIKEGDYEILYKYYCPDKENPDVFNIEYFFNENEDYKNKEYHVDKIPLTWEQAIDDFGQINSISEQIDLFNNFLSNLPNKKFSLNNNIPYMFYRWSPLYYQDYYAYYDENNQRISEDKIDFLSSTYIVSEYDAIKNEYITVSKPLPQPVYTVNYENYIYLNNYHINKAYTSAMYNNNYNECLTYISFDEFKTIWTPLSEKELNKLNLDGDYPKRNKTPYPHPTYEQAYGSSSSAESLVAGEMNHRKNLITKLEENSLNESAYSLLCSDFFPRVDDITRQENEARSRGAHPLPPFKLSILEQVDKIPEYDLIDPYRNGKINPIDNWKKYFNKREIYTIPSKTIVRGDKQIISPKGSPNNPYVHPRETSYSNEDGARRYYGDDKYISPIIEYQKIIRLNWERLPQKKEDEVFVQANWKTDKNCNWGDGFTSSIKIPFKINKQVQSPFSESDKVTKPVGIYCHNCVKPENQMRYHIEWYDSLEKIRKFDFPNYINIINDFQMMYLPKELQSSSSIEMDTTIDENGNEIPQEINVTYLKSYYQEDFNDYERTLSLRKEVANIYPDDESNDENQNPIQKQTWEELLNEYWQKINEEHHFSDMPIVRNRDCYGNETQENAFIKLNNGKTIWRTPTTYFLPTIDKVAVVTNEYGEQVYGYYDSEGKIRKGGNVVNWNNPYEQNDGKWVEQCLGAVIKVKCVQILQDGLGYRWKQEIIDTALTSKDALKGSDYDL